jgi:uncharacterized protein (DUF983 family)
MNVMDDVGINKNEPVIEVNHKDLERASDNSAYRSDCPKCKEGVLLVYRNPKTLVLQEYDRCVLCGQQFKYLDIDELRKAEGSS